MNARQLLEAGPSMTGQWFEVPSSGTIVYTRSRIEGDLFNTLVWSADGRIGPVVMKQHMSGDWRPIAQPTGLRGASLESARQLVDQLLES